MVLVMYIRRSARKRTDGSEVAYLQLCHNEWDASRGRSVTKVLHSLGREDQLDPDAVERLIASLRRLLSPEAQLAEAGAAEAMVWQSSARFGGTWALDGLWRQLGIDATLRGLLKGRRADGDVERVIFALVANRALEPMSEARGGHPLGWPPGGGARAGSGQR